jgi:flagellar protein FlaF
MYDRLYAEASGDSFANARKRERELLQEIIRKLAMAKQRGPLSAEAFEATSYMRRLWSAFIADLSSEENALPPPLRASLISIGLWMHGQADLIDSGRSTNFDGLIEINQIIADGLI